MLRVLLKAIYAIYIKNIMRFNIGTKKAKRGILYIISY